MFYTETLWKTCVTIYKKKYFFELYNIDVFSVDWLRADMRGMFFPSFTTSVYHLDGDGDAPSVYLGVFELFCVRSSKKRAFEPCEGRERCSPVFRGVGGGLMRHSSRVSSVLTRAFVRALIEMHLRPLFPDKPSDRSMWNFRWSSFLFLIFFVIGWFLRSW